MRCVITRNRRRWSESLAAAAQILAGGGKNAAPTVGRERGLSTLPLTINNRKPYVRERR